MLTRSLPPPMPMRPLARAALAGVRHGIDRIDGAMLSLLAARRRLARIAGSSKRQLCRPVFDDRREAQVQARARRLGEHLHLRRETVEALMSLLINDARHDQNPAMHDETSTMTEPHPPSAAQPWLRLLPPPRRWRPLLRRLPTALHEAVVVRALSRALAPSHLGSALDAVEGRRLGIEVTDLDLRWVLQWRGGRLHIAPGPAEASVRGSATDLMLLASRLEDADTLFFQRRLLLSGDTELGLTIRNLLDRMPWEALPLALRIVLQRSGQLLRAARQAHHA